jgi:hypothetical protein
MATRTRAPRVTLAQAGRMSAISGDLLVSRQKQALIKQSTQRAELNGVLRLGTGVHTYSVDDANSGRRRDDAPERKAEVQ